VNGLLQTLRGLGPIRLAMIAGVTLAMVAFFVFLTTRITTPGMALLYSDLELRDSGQIVQKLEAMNVPYQLKGDGSQILVPVDQVARLRMALAETGLPHGGSIGYEIFDKTDALGTSSLVQNINHVRALEGELGRTISSITAVQSARVHLVLPERALFSRDRQEPSASVIVKMRGAERLAKGQVAAMQYLVASAVPSLKPTRVSIVDADGTLLARGDGDTSDAGGGGGNAEERRIAYETRLARNVEELLERTVGPGKARVDVHADMDFDRFTTTSESFDPDQQVARSTQTVTDNSENSETGDQPVTVQTNLPNAQTAASTGAGRSKTSHQEETSNFEIGKKVVSQVRETGLVRRLSVAALVDGVYTIAADGTRSYQPRSPEDMKQLSTLVRSAIGYDEKRGDTVEMVNLRFTTVDEIMPPPPVTFFGFERADILKMGEMLVIAVVAMLFILLVVRPLLMRVLENSGAAAGGNNLLAGQHGGSSMQALPAPAGLNPALAAPGGAGAMMSAAAAERQAQDAMIDIGQVEGRVAASSIRKIGEIVEKHPEEAVAIVRSWMYQGA
jgi:flagellar M-ring protein FliF